MSQKLIYDLVVVGAGPAGCSVAETASSQGIHTLVIEKKSTIGLPVRCAGYIPKLLIRGIDIDKGCIIQDVDKMKTHTPWGEVVETRAPGYIVDRWLFDKSLASNAIRKGADVMIKTRFLHICEEGVIVKREKEEIRIEAKVIVGADGPVSTVGKGIRKQNKQFIAAAQCEVFLSKPMKDTEIYFDSKYTEGYAWLFPRGETANVGVGSKAKTGQRPEKALKHFMTRLVQAGKIEKNATVGYTHGLIPVGGYLDDTQKGNVLLVGDAAGQTDAITGAGIPQAVLCGEIAGKVAAKAIKEQDLMILGEYEKRWKSLFGNALNKAFAKRKLLDNHWSTEDLDPLIRKTWVAFDAYWRQ